MTIINLSGRVFRQYIAGLTCSLSVVILGTAIGWPSPSIPKLKGNETQVQVNDIVLTWMVSLLYFANILSPIPCGYLMDRFGRKATLLYLTVFPITSWIVLLYASDPYHLYIGRFIGGLSFGVVYTVLPIYLAEISEPKIRGSLSNSISMMTLVGALYVYAIGPYVHYRTLIYSCLTVPVLFIITFMWMPESPYYLIMKNDRESAKKSLTWLRCDKAEEDIDKELSIIDIATQEQMKQRGKYKDLLSTNGSKKALIIVQVLAVAQRLTGIGALMAYSSITIPKNSIPGVSLNELITFLGLVWFLSGVAASFLVDRLGRKCLLIVSCVGCGLSTLSTSVWFYLHQKTNIAVDDLTFIPYTSFIFHALFYSLGIGPIGTSIKGELFPANIKSKASAVTTIVLAATSFVLNKSYLIIADNFGMYLNYLIFAVVCFSAVIFVAVYVIETKGKSLDDIQNELNGITKNKSNNNNNNNNDNI
ncbi:facilitated trehalose transporter Tret1-like isoform X1 [Lycorma delicatula]|uniref:facilitated trehalose transporter Tret1-like isoform X1 n=1 Tax=Lycorma delicatula TaxID=130591 RepID=UPI003F510662